MWLKFVRICGHNLQLICANLFLFLKFILAYCWPKFLRILPHTFLLLVSAGLAQAASASLPCPSYKTARGLLGGSGRSLMSPFALQRYGVAVALHESPPQILALPSLSVISSSPSPHPSSTPLVPVTPLQRYSVTVQNPLFQTLENTSIFIYIYIYKYRVNFWPSDSRFLNCNTVTV